MSNLDWTNEEYLANLAADELRKALAAVGVEPHVVTGNDDGDVSIVFGSLREAETMLTLSLTSDGLKGSFYDRAASHCRSLAEAGDASEDEIRRLIETGWRWTIHPAMHGRIVGWHATLDLPYADAYQVTAALNAIPKAAS